MASSLLALTAFDEQLNSKAEAGSWAGAYYVLRIFCVLLEFSDVLLAVQSSVFHAADSQYEASHSFCTEGITVTCVREG